VIRKILLVLSDQTSVGTTRLRLLIAMVIAFVPGRIAVSRFEKGTGEPGGTPRPCPD